MNMARAAEYKIPIQSACCIALSLSKISSLCMEVPLHLRLHYQQMKTCVCDVTGFQVLELCILVSETNICNA